MGSIRIGGSEKRFPDAFANGDAKRLQAKENKADASMETQLGVWRGAADTVGS
jgi:hypothetical protein